MHMNEDQGFNGASGVLEPRITDLRAGERPIVWVARA